MQRDLAGLGFLVPRDVATPSVGWTSRRVAMTAIVEDEIEWDVLEQIEQHLVVLLLIVE
jgi:hypothetical protein